MKKDVPEYHDMFLQFPQILWEKLCDEAESKGTSIAKLVAEVFRIRYDVPPEDLPKPKRVGRKPKR